MASEFAQLIAKTVTKSNYDRALLHRGPIRIQATEICEAVDAELQEVREVLDGLRDGGCWCGVEPSSPDEIVPVVFTPHSDACQRARALMSKLEQSGECCGKGPYSG